MAPRFRWVPLIGRPGFAIQFVDLSTESPTEWAWTFYDADGTTVLGTSNIQNPVFTWARKGDYPVTLAVVESGGSTLPPPVDPGNPPPTGYPPAGIPADDPSATLLAGRALTVNTIFALGLPTVWTVLQGGSPREGTIQIWDASLTTIDSDGLHLAMAEDAPGGPYRTGAVEAQLGLRKGLYAWKLTAVPHGPHVRTSILLYSLTGDQELGVFEDPGIDATHYYTRTLAPNTPTRSILIDFDQAVNIVAMDWTDTGIQFYLNWYPLGNRITDPAILNQFAQGLYAVSIHTSVGGPWAGTPDASTDTFMGTSPELVVQWFRHWAQTIPTPPPNPPPDGGATDASYRDSVLAEIQGFAHGYVTGGRNGPLFVVTSTADSGPGTLRDALSQGNRWITFDSTVFPYAVPVPVGPLLSPIDARGINNITIDGYGALPYLPDGSYGITTGDFHYAPIGATNISNNWIIVNLKHAGTPTGNYDCLTLDGTDLFAGLHCDFQGGGDGSVDLTMVGSGPSAQGRVSFGYTKIGAAKTEGKDCLLGDQTAADGSNPDSYDYASPSSTYPPAPGVREGGDCLISIYACEFFGRLRNPVFANYHGHIWDTYVHDYDLEGISIMGLNAKVRTLHNVIDGDGATYPERGILAWDYDPHPDNKKAKWVYNEGNVFLNGADYTDGSSFTNPNGNQLVIPYTFSQEQDPNIDGGLAMIARRTDPDLTNIRRAGQIVRKGYHQLVGNPQQPPTPGTGRDWQVPAEGSLQAVVDQAQPNDNIYVTGLVTTTGKIMNIANRDNGNLPITIIGNPGNVLRGGESGLEGYGSCRGWHIDSLNIEVDGGAYYGEGVYFGGQRIDQGGDGQGAADIRITNCTVNPISGTGTIQRNGIAVWGADVVEIGGNVINDCAYNDLGFPGGAGSGWSCGESIGSSRPNLANGARFWIHDNIIDGMIGPGTGSYDRNGGILDLFHGSPGNPPNANRSHGLVLIEDNQISNCEGRGIQLLCAGQIDSQIQVLRNTVSGDIATNLDGSEPIAAIGGYGDGRYGNVIVSDNDCSGITPGPDAYKFISFNADFGALSGVLGSGNVGSPVVFEDSATNTPPVGFT